MVPPGAHYEFFEGPVFVSLTHGQQELIAAITQETRMRYDRFEKLEEELRVGSIKFGGVQFGFVVQRYPRGRMSLVWVWNKDRDELSSDDVAKKIAEWRRT